MKEKEINTAAVETAAANMIDAFASKLTGATTPISLDISAGIGVKGCIGDVQVSCTCEISAALSNEAHRRTVTAAAKAEAEDMAATKREALRLLDRYTGEELAEIIKMIK